MLSSLLVLIPSSLSPLGYGSSNSWISASVSTVRARLSQVWYGGLGLMETNPAI